MAAEHLPEDFGEAENAFSEALIDWELRLLTATEDELEALQIEAVQALDALCPFIDEPCYMSGTALMPIGREGEMGIGTVENLLGFSMGLQVLKESITNVPRLFHAFLVKKVEYAPSPVYSRVETFVGYLDLGGTIIPADALQTEQSLEDEIAGTEVDKGVAETLFGLSKDFRACLRSTYFRRLARSDQKKFIGDYFVYAEEKAKVTETPVLAKADYVWRPVTLPDGSVSWEIVPLNQTPLGGICRGFGSLEWPQISSKAIRRDNDMFDREAGLCILVEVNEAPDSSPFHPEEVVLLPLSGQKPALVFGDRHAYGYWVDEEANSDSEEDPPGEAHV